MLTNNTASDNDQGIYLGSSLGNLVTNNNMLNNGIIIYGETDDQWYPHLIDGNTVNSKPVVFWKDKKNVTSKIIYV